MPLATSTKSRSFEPPGLKGVHRRRFIHFAVPPQPWVITEGVVNPRSLRGRQVTASENHPGFANASPLDGDVGGPFSMQLRQTSVGSGSVSMKGSTVVDGVGYVAEYTGPFLACDPESDLVSWPVLQGRSDSTLEALGTKAIAIAKPTNSVADAATALIELYREGLPKMIGSTLWNEKFSSAKKFAEKSPEKASKEFLNLEFGLKPLLSDIQDVYKAIKTADAVMKQYERDAGKVVRRKFEFPSEEDATTTLVPGEALPYIPVSSSIIMKPGDGSALRGRIRITDQYFRRTWFSGAFTYHLPSDWYKQGSSSKMDKLLGTKVTPEVVWNVTPWSWFADWFANTGDVISNLTDMASDGLVLRYGYVMEHERHVRTISYEGAHPYNTEATPQPLIFVNETKRRLASSPYGFGLTFEGFSSRQKAILAALGITKSKRRKGK
jgi:hypothetical protein